MKRNISISFLILFTAFSFAQTTAVNFICNDCKGTSHKLFTELDEGKVIVLAWVMPCATCIPPSRSAYDAVQTYISSHPGRVKFYLADDYGNTSCNTLTIWANNNGMPEATIFSNTAVNPANYGNVGMPKIVVLGGLNHQVLYNEDNGNNLSGLKPAINTALITTSINDNATIISEYKIQTNYSENKATLLYSLSKNSDVTIEVYDITGKKIKSLLFGEQLIGEHEILISLNELPSGLSIFKLITDTGFKSIKFLNVY